MYVYFMRYSVTHWGWDKMAAIIQTTYSNAFYWTKMEKIECDFTEICTQGSN